jgi:hypothetical protein
MKPLTFGPIIGALLVPIAIASTPAAHDLTPREGAVVGQAVVTTSGTVKGHPAENVSEVSEYLGIPYAQPPVGSLRWQPPVNYTGTGIVNGTNFVSSNSS